jgi:hypothetical protein
MEITTHSWHIRLTCGKELHGSEMGSFANVKNRTDIADLWVVTGAGEKHALKHAGRQPSGFDFYVHVSVSLNGDGTPEKHWKLIAIYPDHKLVRHIAADGRNRLERVP